MGILRGNAAPVVVVFSIIAFFSIRNHDTIPKWTPSSSSKAVLLQSDFIADFTHALVPSVIATHSNTERPPDGGFLVFTPFILRDGMLLCHRKFEIRFARQSTFIDMIRATLGSCGDDRNRTVMVHRPMPPPPGLPPIGEFVLRTHSHFRRPLVPFGTTGAGDFRSSTYSRSPILVTASLTSAMASR
jgi:hypothetical protein